MNEVRDNKEREREREREREKKVGVFGCIEKLRRLHVEGGGERERKD
jgi:hypothetical protein